MLSKATDRAKSVLLMWLSMLLVLVSVSVLFSPFVCQGDFSNVMPPSICWIRIFSMLHPTRPIHN